MNIPKTKIGSYEFKTHSSEILKLAESGETITITRHGKPIAQVIPFKENASTRRKAFEGLMELSKSFSASGRSISHDEFKAWINSGRP